MKTHPNTHAKNNTKHNLIFLKQVFQNGTKIHTGTPHPWPQFHPHAPFGSKKPTQVHPGAPQGAPRTPRRAPKDSQGPPKSARSTIKKRWKYVYLALQDHEQLVFFIF